MDLSPVLISLRTASAAIVVTFFTGLLAAALVAQTRRREWKMILDGILTLPLVLPPTVAGFFLLYIFGVRAPLGKFFLDFFSLRIAFSWSATVLASAAISFPLMYRSARGALEQLDPNLAYAARTLGMPELAIFWKVSFPTAMPGIVSGAVLAFARGLGEIWRYRHDRGEYRGKNPDSAPGYLFGGGRGGYGRSL